MTQTAPAPQSQPEAATPYQHVCPDVDCCYYGRPSFRGCGCYRTREQMMLARIEELTKALQAILDENDEFRKGMPTDWEGDPLQDACDAARRALVPSLEDRGAILGYLSVFDACDGSESVNPERFADARHSLREAVAEVPEIAQASPDPFVEAAIAEDAKWPDPILGAQAQQLPIGPRDLKPITMSEIRLAAGEGKLSAHDVLAAANAVLRMRQRALAPPSAEQS